MVLKISETFDEKYNFNKFCLEQPKNYCRVEIEKKNNVIKNNFIEVWT